MRNVSDESLLAGLGSGDPDATAVFVRWFQRRVFGLTFSILRDHGAAEEAAQELRARMEARFGLRPVTRNRGSVAAWLLTINMLPARRFDPIDPEVLLAWRRSDHARTGRGAAVDAELLRTPLARLAGDRRRALVLPSSTASRRVRSASSTVCRSAP
jgi:RNA polymerase sigma-70 factor (ECF subfamily)